MRSADPSRWSGTPSWCNHPPSLPRSPPRLPLRPRSPSRPAVAGSRAPVAVAAPAPAATAPAAASPAPAAEAATVPAADAPAAAPPAAVPPTPVAAPAEHAEVSLDQETFDRVLAELLEKGTDRRVAEGQARRAAMIAARKKAEG